MRTKFTKTKTKMCVWVQRSKSSNRWWATTDFTILVAPCENWKRRTRGSALNNKPHDKKKKVHFWTITAMSMVVMMMMK